MTPHELAPKLYKSPGEVSFVAARRLVQDAAWWVQHPSGSPCREPGYREQVIEANGFPVRYGLNTFWVGRAIHNFLAELCVQLESSDQSDLVHSWRSLQREFLGAVEGAHGDAIESYPISRVANKNFMVFGVHGVCLVDVQQFFKNWIVLDDAKELLSFQCFHCRHQDLLPMLQAMNSGRS